MSILDLAKAHAEQCCEAAEKAARPVFGTGNFKKKVVSESLAVHPDQIAEAREVAKKLGVAVPDFDCHGRPTFDNSAHMRRYSKRHGFRHKQY